MAGQVNIQKSIAFISHQQLARNQKGETTPLTAAAKKVIGKSLIINEQEP